MFGSTPDVLLRRPVHFLGVNISPLLMVALLFTIVPNSGCRPSNARKGRVVKELRDECRSGNAKVCHALGWMHLDGRGVRRSPLLAFRYWNLSCHLNYRPACDRIQELRHLRGRARSSHVRSPLSPRPWSPSSRK